MSRLGVADSRPGGSPQQFLPWLLAPDCSRWEKWFPPSAFASVRMNLGRSPRGSSVMGGGVCCPGENIQDSAAVKADPVLGSGGVLLCVRVSMGKQGQLLVWQCRSPAGSSLSRCTWGCSSPALQAECLPSPRTAAKQPAVVGPAEEEEARSPSLLCWAALPRPGQLSALPLQADSKQEPRAAGS